MFKEQDLKPLIQNYEAKMGVEIIVVLAKNASHYLTVPLIYSAIFSLPLPFLLYHLTNLSFNTIMTLQLVMYVASFLLINFTPLKLLLTPNSHINDRLKQRARDILWAYNAFTKHQHGALLLFIAEKENKAIVRADNYLSEKVSEEFLKKLTDNYRTHHSIEIMLELASNTIYYPSKPPNSADDKVFNQP